MKRDKPSFPQALELLAQVAERDLDEHPSPQILLAYHRGELVPAEEEDLQEHLMVCRDCVMLARDLPAFLGEEIDEDTGEDIDLDAAFRALAEKAATAGPLRAPAKPRSTPRILPGAGAPRRDPRVSWFALAASLLAILSAAGWLWTFLESHSLEERLREVTKPRFGVSIQDAIEVPSERTSDVPSALISMDDNSGQTVLILTPRLGVLDHSGYKGRIVDREGRVVISDAPLKPTPFGTFTLALVHGSLAPGSYTVEIEGLREGASSQVGRWIFEILKAPREQD